jgi:adenosine deaminase CECR1
MVLGYVKDLRQHPVSYLIRRGVQASISSDDPGLFGYEGTTLDYLYAMGSWMLDLRDLKQLSLNGIKYASVSQETKDKLLTEVFEPRWNNWIQQIISESLPENMPV